MSTWIEIWTRPGDTSPGRVIDGLPVSQMTLHDTINGLGDGSARVASSFDRFDEILLIDGASSVRSTARLFDESDSTTPIFEWFPTAMLPTSSKSDFDVNISGLGIKSMTRDAVTQAYDWDGSDDFIPAQPDWEWGANNIVGNPGFESPTFTPVVYQLQITATGGTFTLSDGTDTTSAIAFNASAATIATELQTDIAAITDVNVVQISSSPRTHLIQFVDPPVGITLTINTGSLTGGTATLTLTQEGESGITPWTRAKAIVSGVASDYGEASYDTFELSTEQNHTTGGQYSLKINPTTSTATSNRNPGAQQVLSVTPGQVIQVSIWVYPTSGTDQFRLGLFGLGEEFIAWNASSGATLTPNQWNQITLTDVLIPDNVDELIMRLQVSNAGPHDPSTFYIDDGELYPGLPPDSIGGIIEALYNSYVDSAIRSPIVWDDGTGTNTPYLTLDFTDAVDSAGNAWFETEVQIKVWQRMTLEDVLNQLTLTYDIEWRIVADNVETMTYHLQVYNPGGMQTDYTAAASPAIQGGSSDVIRQLRRILPQGTEVMIEGEGRLTARDRDSDLVTALGRMETAELDREVVSLSAAAEEAFSIASGLDRDGMVYSYVLVNPQDQPLVDYQIGDALTVHDPPEVEDEARLVDVTATFTPDQVEWNVIFEPRTVSGS